MLQPKRLLNLENFTNFLLYVIPISLIAGSLIINLNILAFIIFGAILIKKKKLTFQLNKTKLFLSIFFILIVISSIINISIVGLENITKSIFLLRFLILYFIIEILLINNLLNLRKLFAISLICTSFVSIDLLIQYIFGKNILGFEPIANNVLTGVFFDEAIAGGFIQKLFLLSLIGLIIFYDKKNFPKKYIVPAGLIHTIAIFVSTNKMPFVLIMFSILLLILFFKELRIHSIVCFILTIVISIIIAKNDANLHQRYKSFYVKIFGTETAHTHRNINIENEQTKRPWTVAPSIISKMNFFQQGVGSEHGIIYLVAFESFKKSMLIGNGLKSIRINCKKVVLEKGEMCLAHPHNFHLEILNDTGLLGYLSLAFFVILTILKSLKNYRYKTTFVQKCIFIFILLNFLIEIWPLKSTGSLFSTWTGSITWLTVALTSYNLKNTSLK